MYTLAGHEKPHQTTYYLFTLFLFFCLKFRIFIQITLKEKGHENRYRIQTTDLLQERIGDDVLPPIGQTECGAEPEAMDQEMYAADARTESGGVYAYPQVLFAQRGGTDCEIFGRALIPHGTSDSPVTDGADD